MGNLEKLIGSIVNENLIQIKSCIEKDLLSETVQMVLEIIYKQINDGKIQLIGVIDQDIILKECVSLLKSTPK